jgi:hypothetical protein
MLRRAAIRRLLASTALFAVGMMAIEVLWQPRFTDLLGGVDGAVERFGFLATATFAATGLGAGLARIMPRVFAGSASRTGAVLHVAAGMTMVALALVGSFMTAASLFVLTYILIGARMPLAHELLHENVPGSERATMVSAESLAMQVGALAASIGLAALAQAEGIPAAWVVAAAIAAAGGWFLLRVPEEGPTGER